MSNETTIDQKRIAVNYINELTTLCRESIQSAGYVYHNLFKELTTDQIVEVDQTVNSNFRRLGLKVVPTLIFKDGVGRRVLKVQKLKTFNAFEAACPLIEKIVNGLKANTLELPLEVTASELEVEDASDFYDVYQELRHELSVFVVELTIIGDTPRILITPQPHSSVAVKTSDRIVINTAETTVDASERDLEETNPNVPPKQWKPSDGFMESPDMHDTPIETDLNLKLHEHLEAGFNLETFEYHTHILDTLRGTTLDMVLTSVNNYLSPRVFKFNTKEVEGVMRRTLVLDLPEETVALQVKSLKSDRITFINGINEIIDELDYYLLGGDKPKHMETSPRLTEVYPEGSRKDYLVFHFDKLSLKQCEVLMYRLQSKGWGASLREHDSHVMNLTLAL